MTLCGIAPNIYLLLLEILLDLQALRFLQILKEVVRGTGKHYIRHMPTFLTRLALISVTDAKAAFLFLKRVLTNPSAVSGNRGIP